MGAKRRWSALSLPRPASLSLSTSTSFSLASKGKKVLTMSEAFYSHAHKVRAYTLLFAGRELVHRTGSPSLPPSSPLLDLRFILCSLLPDSLLLLLLLDRLVTRSIFRYTSNRKHLLARPNVPSIEADPSPLLLLRPDCSNEPSWKRKRPCSGGRSSGQEEQQR